MRTRKYKTTFKTFTGPKKFQEEISYLKARIEKAQDLHFTMSEEISSLKEQNQSLADNLASMA